MNNSPLKEVLNVFGPSPRVCVCVCEATRSFVVPRCHLLTVEVAMGHLLPMGQIRRLVNMESLPNCC